MPPTLLRNTSLRPRSSVSKKQQLNPLQVSSNEEEIKLSDTTKLKSINNLTNRKTF
jgi:hypothetical protein